jgi:hypothetical protein
MSDPGSRDEKFAIAPNYEERGFKCKLSKAMGRISYDRGHKCVYIARSIASLYTKASKRVYLFMHFFHLLFASFLPIFECPRLIIYIA